MPRLLLPASRVVLGLALALLAAALLACDASTPTPPPPPPQPTVLAARMTATLEPTTTAEPTEASTLTPSPISSATAPPEPSLTRPVPAPPKSGAVGNKVWFMSQLITYFKNLGPYPPEPPIARPDNVNPLTGLVVADPALLKRRPLLVRLGNDPQARPQAGLNQADLVFEEMIDQQRGFFAVTRLTAVFLGQDATVRPLRSARQVNASLQPMLDGALAHSGAGKGVRFLFSNLPWGTPLTRSLNQDDLWFGSNYCVIGNSWITRVASTTTHIRENLASKGLEKAVTLRGFEFSEIVPHGKAAASAALDHLPWPVQTASAQWKYDAASGRYLRFSGGVAHSTQQYGISGKWGGACSTSGETTTEQVSAANVIVINAEYEPTDAHDFTEDSLGSTSVFIELTGSGTARIYRDGIEIAGRWERPTLQHWFRFVDSGGNVVPLKPGNSWIEIAPLGYAPTVK